MHQGEEYLKIMEWFQNMHTTQNIFDTAVIHWYKHFLSGYNVYIFIIDLSQHKQSKDKRQIMKHLYKRDAFK